MHRSRPRSSDAQNSEKPWQQHHAEDRPMRLLATLGDGRALCGDGQRNRRRICRGVWTEIALGRERQAGAGIRHRKNRGRISPCGHNKPIRTRDCKVHRVAGLALQDRQRSARYTIAEAEGFGRSIVGLCQPETGGRVTQAGKKERSEQCRNEQLHKFFRNSMHVPHISLASAYTGLPILRLIPQ